MGVYLWRRHQYHRHHRGFRHRVPRAVRRGGHGMVPVVPTATASIVIDVNKGATPDGSNTSVAGTEKPTLSAAAAYAVASDTSLSTWTDTTWAKGEYIHLDVDSVTNTKRAYLSLLVR